MVVVSGVLVRATCMCTCSVCVHADGWACRTLHCVYIRSGADVKYINVSNLHQLQCIYIQGMSLQNGHSVISICHAEFQYER